VKPQIINHLKLVKERKKIAFVSRAPDFQNITALFDGSQASPPCSSNTHHEDNYFALVE
jgi:hypothetical protein